jgi:hypothetical protein
MPTLSGTSLGDIRSPSKILFQKCLAHLHFKSFSLLQAEIENGYRKTDAIPIYRECDYRSWHDLACEDDSSSLPEFRSCTACASRTFSLTIT